MTIETFLRPHIATTPAYTPILPFDVLSEQLGIPIEEIIKVDANENPFGPLPEVEKVLANLKFTHIYPDPESRRLRESLSAYHGVRFENILVGAGADELIDLIMRLFLDPGDCIINCPPTFGMYDFDAGLNAARTVSVPRNAEFSLNLKGIEDAVVRHNPKLLFIANPNNPDGGLLSKEEVERLRQLPVVLVLDEAYMEFAPNGHTFLREAPTSENLIVLRTFSKWAGLAGLRVGYGLFPNWVMPHLWKVKQPYNVSVAAQEAALVSLKYAEKLGERRNSIVAERSRLMKALARISFLEPYPSHSNFILCRVVGQDAAILKTSLAQQGILIRYFNKPGLSDHVRISVGLPEENSRVLEILKNVNEQG